MDVRHWADRGQSWQRIGGAVGAGLLAALLLGGPGLAVGEAESTAVEVGPVRIGSASAQAGPEGSEADSSASATAFVVDVGPVHEEVGGSQRGAESSAPGSGELAGVQHEDVGHARVLPWDVSVDDRKRSESSASLLEVVAKGLFRLDVARGQAAAEDDGASSSGSASSDGIALAALERVDLSVLHAESRSDGTGRTWVARLNNVEIGGNGELSECPLSLPFDVDVDIDVSVNCVAATGGGGGSSSAVRSQTAGAAVSSTSGRSAQGPAAVTAASPAPASAATAATAAPASDNASAAVAGSGLVRTGTSPLHLVAIAFALLAWGSVVMVLARPQSLRKLR